MQSKIQKDFITIMTNFPPVGTGWQKVYDGGVNLFGKYAISGISIKTEDYAWTYRVDYLGDAYIDNNNKIYMRNADNSYLANKPVAIFFQRI